MRESGGEDKREKREGERREREREKKKKKRERRNDILQREEGAEREAKELWIWTTNGAKVETVRER